MPTAKLADAICLFLTFAGAMLSPLDEVSAQTFVHKVSTSFDSVSAPSAHWLPGLNGAFRMQILIDESRLGTVKGKDIVGFVVRRDLAHSGAQTGGSISLTVRASSAAVLSARAMESFAANAAAASQKLVLSGGAVAVPNSPVVSAKPALWSSSNSVQVNFASSFGYDKGTLCLDLVGVPVTGKAPLFWYVDHEQGAGSGKIKSFGRSCSTVASGADTLVGLESGLQIGNSMRFVLLGRPGDRPVFLIGSKPFRTGSDLTSMGATKCSLYVDYFMMIGLVYNVPVTGMNKALANLEVQIPYNVALLGASVFVQSADFQKGTKTNPAALTTSNGLELSIASKAPALGMSTVRSHEVDPTLAVSKWPTTGKVDVERAPVIRLLYRNRK